MNLSRFVLREQIKRVSVAKSAGFKDDFRYIGLSEIRQRQKTGIVFDIFCPDRNMLIETFRPRIKHVVGSSIMRLNFEFANIFETFCNILGKNNNDVKSSRSKKFDDSHLE